MVAHGGMCQTVLGTKLSVEQNNARFHHALYQSAIPLNHFETLNLTSSIQKLNHTVLKEKFTDANLLRRDFDIGSTAGCGTCYVLLLPVYLNWHRARAPD